MTGVEPMVEPRNAHRQSINQKLSDLKGHQSDAIDSLAAVNECLLAIFWRKRRLHVESTAREMRVF